MERSLFELSPPTRWVGARLDVFDTVDSTNLVAERLAADGAPEGTLVIADRQTAGRGRLGRSFFSPGSRSVYLSLLLRPELEPDRVHQHIFAAAVAVARTARAHLPERVGVEIKWPNDVLLEGRKTSGINLPTRVDGDRVEWAVLGIGVNVNTLEEEFPPELRPIATSLRIAGGAPVSRVSFAEALLAALEVELDALRESGFAGVLDRWQKFFRMRGTRVRVGGVRGPRELEGSVEGVDPEGALLVETREGIERILAGDVALLTRAHGRGA